MAVQGDNDNWFGRTTSRPTSVKGTMGPSGSRSPSKWIRRPPRTYQPASHLRPDVLGAKQMQVDLRRVTFLTRRWRGPRSRPASTSRSTGGAFVDDLRRRSRSASSPDFGSGQALLDVGEALRRPTAALSARGNSPPVGWARWQHQARPSLAVVWSCSAERLLRALGRVSQGGHRSAGAREPDAALATLQQAWSERQYVVVELAVDSKDCRSGRPAVCRSTT